VGPEFSTRPSVLRHEHDRRIALRLLSLLAGWRLRPHRNIQTFFMREDTSGPTSIGRGVAPESRFKVVQTVGCNEWFIGTLDDVLVRARRPGKTPCNESTHPAP
jgi:hypothetical protein